MLEGLQKIYDEVKKPLTCAEDSITLCSTSSIPVTIDCNDRISLCVNGAIVNSTNALPVTITNTLPLEVNINQANDSILIYGFDGTVNQPISVDANGFVNTNASVTFPGSLPVTQDPASDPWTVDATDLDIRNLDCTTDSISICDPASGGALVVNNAGGPSDGSINSVLVDFTSGATAVINPDGTQNNQIYAYNITTLQPQALTSTTTSPGVEALDINQVSFVRTPNILSATGTGIIAPVVYSISFSNIGPDPELISFDSGTTWTTIPSGVSVTMDAGGNNKYPAGVFGYDVIGTGPILIVYNT
jgi:hypothetical protein